MDSGMPLNQIIGLGLVVGGAVDALAALVLAPRIPDQKRRRTATLALMSTGVTMAGLGLAAYFSLIGTGR